jgi:hypothetical protein
VSSASERHLRAAIVELRAAASLGSTTALQILPLALGDVRLGRPVMDDAAALAQVRRLEADGDKHAVRTVARQLAGGNDDESIERRLRRKRTAREPR